MRQEREQIWGERDEIREVRVCMSREIQYTNKKSQKRVGGPSCRMHSKKTGARVAPVLHSGSD